MKAARFLHDSISYDDGSENRRREHPVSLTGKILSFRIRVDMKLTLGYRVNVSDVIKAASVMGRRSAEARKKMWGKKEFVRRMQEWGKLGGRPKRTRKKRGRGRKTT